jgi:hypothetical protein
LRAAVFDWLFEGHSSVYLVLATAATILFAVWWRTRKRKYAVGLGIVAGLAGLYGLLDLLRETDREQIIHHVQAMAQAVAEKNLDRAFVHIAKDFRFREMDRDRFRSYAEDGIRRGGVSEIEVWGFELKEMAREKGVARGEFRAKVRGSWGQFGPYHRCEVEFSRDADGQWRLKSLEVYDADTSQPTQLR